jgi:hypothetical protein
MEPHHPILLWTRLRFDVILHVCFLLIVALTFCAATSRAQQASPRRECPSHRNFVSQYLDTVVTGILHEFPFQRGKPLLVDAADSTASDTLFESALIQVLLEQGFLLSSAEESDANGTIRSLLYDIDRFALSLTEPTRRSFLGRIWLQRTLALAFSIEVTDVIEGTTLWSRHVDTTFHDWIPKREVASLADVTVPMFSPAVPSTALERLTIPLLAGTLALSAVTVFLVIQ